MGWAGLRKGIYRFLPGLTRIVDPVVSETLGDLRPGARIADIGAGGRRITHDTVTVDGFVRDNTDVFCDIHRVALADDSFDAVFCTGTLEHVDDPDQVLDEIHRLVVTGGIVHIEVPFLQPFHADPNDFWRWTLPGLRKLCERHGFEEIRSGTHIGSGSALNWTLNEYLLQLFGRGMAGSIVSGVFRFVGYPLLLIEAVFCRGRLDGHAASAVYFVGSKP